MKQINFLIISILVLLCSSCKENDPEIPSIKSAEKNQLPELRTVETEVIDEFIDQLNGKWTITDALLNTYEFRRTWKKTQNKMMMKGNSGKYTSTTQTEERLYQSYAYSYSCPFNEFVENLNDNEFIMTDLDTESCRIIQIRNDTLFIADLNHQNQKSFIRL
ncbi:hypothetical protein [Nonlabens antarcticus]|uniref:hypothetical protein n=1 Tax=Nonlabens antarcticus TaxID=392714 RepID=UPI001890E044|nr:hypothetical protein [Nonlabens antarcticus]